MVHCMAAVALLCVLLALAAGPAAGAREDPFVGYQEKAAPEEHITLRTNFGPIRIKLFSSAAPQTTRQVLQLAQQGCSGCHFYRNEAKPWVSGGGARTGAQLRAGGRAGGTCSGRAGSRAAAECPRCSAADVQPPSMPPGTDRCAPAVSCSNQTPGRLCCSKGTGRRTPCCKACWSCPPSRRRRTKSP